MSTKSHWNIEMPRFAPLDRDLSVDVAVVGAGITGITAALLLKQAGLSVALFERDRACFGDTGMTTAHVTQLTDIRLHTLIRDFGRDHARAVWDAGGAAIEQIHQNVRDEKLACEFRWIPGFLHATASNHEGKARDELEKESVAAHELGIDAELFGRTPLIHTPGLRFANQAKFHPLKYLAGLLAKLPSKRCHVFENSEVDDAEGDPLHLTVNGHRVTCSHLVAATHVPVTGKSGFASASLLQSKLAPYSSYVIGARAPRNTCPEALFWDTNNPYDYLRVDAYLDHDYIIYGGRDHKTGHEERNEHRFDELAATLTNIVAAAQVVNRWSGQVIETSDGLPFIGETAKGQFVSTGYAGNGMTFGTLGGIMARDWVLGRKNPWQNLFSPGRTKLSGAFDYIKENLDYPFYMVADRLRRVEATAPESLAPGEGKILKLDGKRVAVARDDQGNLHYCSPLCTHMGCIVHWNQAETTWDCPCHGSRFKPSGEVISGPAESPLDHVERKP
jgi:glycine/D-amino acid oxidase-like deaminating enzyme/nitrite reductase/ring-hydroxylating ferredoxin subunit